ncbi:chromo domain-containing protein 1 [Histomonas meleagridis]|uniref:chromo domain-containing protein 1 n=1 Tax=Histomonas meleagridis TaxID=135588 RepID=UPI00355AABF0|nr:chromo domain-containing protein 1 [Histomonas meleagridis]KAH0804782.1 chromo domain-containing protein 1 [Histomonas meleagridis]
MDHQQNSYQEQSKENAQTNKSRQSPYSNHLFASKPLQSKIDQIISNTLSEIDEISGKNSQKNQKISLGSFLENYFQFGNNQKIIKKEKEAPESPPTPAQTIIGETDETDKHIFNEQAKIFVSNVQLPTGPDPSQLVFLPPERHLVPPKLWGKIIHENTLSESEEPVPLSVPTKRRRGRPRKNVDPNEYVPKYVSPSKSRRISRESSESHISRSLSPRESISHEPVQQSTESPDVSKSNDFNTDNTSDHNTSENTTEPVTPTKVYEEPEIRAPRPPHVNFPPSDIDEIVGLKGLEYCVKLKGHSYSDIVMMNREEIFNHENGEEIFSCFKELGISTKEPFFNPLFVEIERVLDIKEDQCLVKWCGLGYKHCTWTHVNKVQPELIERYQQLLNRENEVVDQNNDIDIMSQFSLDEPQNKAVEALLDKYNSGQNAMLYGNIGSILRLEFATLIYILKEKKGINGPFLIVVAPVLYQLVINEMAVYTELIVVGIPDDDEEEFEKIKEFTFINEENKPKFNVLVVSAPVFKRFVAEYPKIDYQIITVDYSEIYGERINLTDINSHMKIIIKKRTDEDEEIDSQDDSTFLHDELTVFCPMLIPQEKLYKSIILENIDLATQPAESVDMSRLYEIFMKLNAVANFPSVLNSQDILIRGNKSQINKKRFEDCGKMRVLTQLITYAQNTKKRLMVLCRDTTILDIIELYLGAFEIPFVRIGPLGVKRMKLDDFSQEAKSNKKIIILAQFETNPINWLSLLLDLIVVFDGVYNPIGTFSRFAAVRYIP